jgi:antitoxin MazE
MSSRTCGEEEALLKVNQRGVISLPKSLRGDANIFAAVRREDGVIELRPKFLVDRSQIWFWTEKWQHMEYEADADVANGRVHRYDSDEDMFADLDRRRAEVRAEA